MEERGVAVVEVSAVMGVERRERVVVKARAAWPRDGVERRERQRVQIMICESGVWLLADIGWVYGRCQWLDLPGLTCS